MLLPVKVIFSIYTVAEDQFTCNGLAAESLLPIFTVFNAEAFSCEVDALATKEMFP